MTAHEATEGFPDNIEALSDYKAIILSDIGANTSLLSPSVGVHRRPTSNELKVDRNFHHRRRWSCVIGGFLNFQGIDGRARWHHTPVDRAVPVACLSQDVRPEITEGFAPEILGPAHPLFPGITDHGRCCLAPMRLW
jgi:uncharacterized membrane protein